MDIDDWREKLGPDSRQRIVNKIMDTLKRHLPFSGQEGLQELKKIAVCFEEKTYAGATSQSDYLRKISLKMLTMETKYTFSNSANGHKPSDTEASHSMHPQVHTQGQSLSISLPANNSQTHQHLSSQNLQNDRTFTGFQLQIPMVQQSMLATQLQPQELMSQRSNSDNVLQSHLIGQQNNLGDMQHQQQRLVGQQNNLQYLQQQQQGLQLMAQKNNLSSMLQRQQQMLGMQTDNLSMQTSQQYVHMMQQPKVPLQGSVNLLPSQGQQSQAQYPALQNNVTSTGVKNSVGLQPAMTSVSGLTQNSIPNASGQNSTMQNIASVPQNTGNYSVWLNMENTNWRAAAPGESTGPTATTGSSESTMDTWDWRAHVLPESRQKIVNKIMETLKRHLPFSGQEGLQELKKIAVRFEEKIYTAATSQPDYLRKISLRMLTMESKSQNTIPNSANGSKPPDPGAASHTMQAQVHNQGQMLPIPLPANQSQACQHLLSQNMQQNMTVSGVQNSVGLQPAMTSFSGLTQTSIPNASDQNSTVQNTADVPQNTVSNLMGQNVPANMYSNAQQQMPGRQQGVPQRQPQFQNPQFLYQLQMIMKQKLQQGNLPHTLAQSHVQQQQSQQQHQSLLQPNQLQMSQQSGVLMSSVMQPSMMQSANLSGLQQNQPSSVQQSAQSMSQHQLLVLRQQRQRLLGEQFCLQNLPQQLMVHQNNLSNIHQQQLGAQINFSGLQQEKMVGAQFGNPSMQTNQQSVHIKQQPNVPKQQKQQVPVEMQTHQMLQLHQTNDANEMKVRQGMGFNSKKMAGLQTRAPLPAILAFTLFVLCLLCLWFLF